MNPGAENSSLSIYGYTDLGNGMIHFGGSMGSSRVVFLTGSTPVTDTNWHHYAAVRGGNTVYLFLDGNLEGTANVAGVTFNDSSNKMVIGRPGEYGGDYANGWIDEFRFSKGIARWTSNFTPPTLEYVASTSTPTPTLTLTPTLTPTSTPSPTLTITPTITFTPTSTPQNPYSYDRSLAVAYADQWAHEPRNANYPLADETGCNCNDCTNYISQVLQNGGYPLRTGNWDENNVFEWWYRDGGLFEADYSLTWANADWINSYFAQYLNEFDVNPPVSTLEGGDFIVLDLRDNDTSEPVPDGIPDHGRVVVGYGYPSTDVINYISYNTNCEVVYNPTPTSVPEPILLINQHCVDRQNVAWDFNIQDIPRWYIHVIE
jgi:hypothetical protein